MARRREQFGRINPYFPYIDAAEQATVSEEGAFQIANAAAIGRPQRGRSFESPTLPARARPAVAALSRAAPPPPKSRIAPTPSGVAPKAGAGFSGTQRVPANLPMTVGNPYAFASAPTHAPNLSGGAAGGGAAQQPGGYKPPVQTFSPVKKGRGRR